MATASAVWTGWRNLCGVSVTPKPRRIWSVICDSAARNAAFVGHVRPLDAEVVLDDPDGAEAELVGQLDLLDRLEVGGLLGLALVVRIRLVGPRLGGLHLVEEVQLHVSLPSGCGWSAETPGDGMRPLRDS